MPLVLPFQLLVQIFPELQNDVITCTWTMEDQCFWHGLRRHLLEDQLVFGAGACRPSIQENGGRKDDHSEWTVQTHGAVEGREGGTHGWVGSAEAFTGMMAIHG